MAVMGFVVLLSFTTAVNYIWPVLLILAGLYAIYRQSGQGGLPRRG